MEASPAWDTRLEKKFRSRVEKISLLLCYKHLPFFLQAKLDMMWNFWKKESDLHKKKKKEKLSTCAAKMKKRNKYRQIVHVTILPYFHAHKIKKTETVPHILPRSYT